MTAATEHLGDGVGYAADDNDYTVNLVEQDLQNINLAAHLQSDENGSAKRGMVDISVPLEVRQILIVKPR